MPVVFEEARQWNTRQPGKAAGQPPNRRVLAKINRNYPHLHRLTVLPICYNILFDTGGGAPAESRYFVQIFTGRLLTSPPKRTILLVALFGALRGHI